MCAPLRTGGSFEKCGDIWIFWLGRVEQGVEHPPRMVSATSAEGDAAGNEGGTAALFIVSQLRIPARIGWDGLAGVGRKCTS